MFSLSYPIGKTEEEVISIMEDGGWKYISITSGKSFSAMSMCKDNVSVVLYFYNGKLDNFCLNVG